MFASSTQTTVYGKFYKQQAFTASVLQQFENKPKQKQDQKQE